MSSFLEHSTTLSYAQGLWLPFRSAAEASVAAGTAKAHTAYSIHCSPHTEEVYRQLL